MKLLAHDLAGMLAFGKFVADDASVDPDVMWKIGYLCDLINAAVERPEPVLQSPDAAIDHARAAK